MAEHLLDLTNVSAILQHVDGAGMSQEMSMDRPAYVAALR